MGVVKKSISVNKKSRGQPKKKGGVYPVSAVRLAPESALPRAPSMTNTISCALDSRAFTHFRPPLAIAKSQQSSQELQGGRRGGSVRPAQSSYVRNWPFASFWET